MIIEYIVFGNLLSGREFLGLIGCESAMEILCINVIFALYDMNINSLLVMPYDFFNNCGIWILFLV